MDDASFATFLSRSLEILEQEQPEVARRLASCLAQLTVALQVDGEQSCLRADGGRVVATRGAPASATAVVVRTVRATLLELIDGRSSLTDAVLRDAVLLRGDREDLVRFHDALWLYLQGAVRAPSMPELLRRYRDAS